METEIHSFVMNNLDDYNMKEERIKIETETEYGHIYGIEVSNEKRQSYYGLIEDKYKQKINEDGVEFEIESEIRRYYDGGMASELQLVIKH